MMKATIHYGGIITVYRYIMIYQNQFKNYVEFIGVSIDLSTYIVLCPKFDVPDASANVKRQLDDVWMTQIEGPVALRSSWWIPECVTGAPKFPGIKWNQ